jgi:hypothetical protein
MRQMSLEAVIRTSAMCDEKILSMLSRRGDRFTPATRIYTRGMPAPQFLPSIRFRRKSFLANNLTVN